jgi:hypothetical protein
MYTDMDTDIDMAMDMDILDMGLDINKNMKIITSSLLLIF